ncbi:MAG TPA: M64 family metallopeptidase [Bacteroidales bacterium]|nr:M64 family metallopeptidase [Bacteroidales bacterium]
MKTRILLLLLFVAATQARPQAAVDFDKTFTGNTMRVDYFHTGTASEEHFSVDRILNDGAWAGSQTVLLDTLNRGLYFYEVTDAATGALLYSRGFASIFGEWQSIAEAKINWGTFHESVRFPWPQHPVVLTISKRDATNKFVPLWNTTIDPAARNVNPAPLQSELTTQTLFENGDPATHVDLVILGDGYSAGEMEKFNGDARRLIQAMFDVEPYKSRKADFNVRLVETPAAESGVNKPHPGSFRRTPLSVSYSAFDSERYALATDNRAIRDAAANVPYDAMFILINEQTYGGGGIYNLYSTVAVDNKFSDYIFVHEFGHSFAGLADEYYTADVSYEMAEITVEPYEPNVTALLDPSALKWQELVEPETPIPTPWDKEAFDAFSYEIQKERRELRAAKVPEARVEALFARERQEMLNMIDRMEYKNTTGAFEGANYMQHGMYRSAIDCIMFTRNKQEFCPACRRAISQVIDQYTK